MMTMHTSRYWTKIQQSYEFPNQSFPCFFIEQLLYLCGHGYSFWSAPGQVAWNGPKGQSRINSRLDCISECDAARYIVLSSQILASSTKQVDDLNILFYFYLQHLLSIVLSGSTGNRTRAPPLGLPQHRHNLLLLTGVWVLLSPPIERRETRPTA